MKNNILCIGEILWDCFPDGRFIGGAPFNVACHLKTLGNNVSFASRIGEDPLGEEIKFKLKAAGIEADNLQTDTQYPTGVVNVNVDSKGNAAYKIIEPAAWDFIESTESIVQSAQESHYLVFGTLAQRNPVSRSTINNLKNIIPVKILDVNLRPPYDDKEIIRNSLRNTDIVKLNDIELLRLSEWFHLNGNQKECAIALSSLFNCKTVCITRGENGAALWHKGNWTEHPGFKVLIKDTVGAGDAFLASLITGILENKDNEQILIEANAVGAYVATCSGATPLLDFSVIDRIKSP